MSVVVVVCSFNLDMFACCLARVDPTSLPLSLLARPTVVCVCRSLGGFVQLLNRTSFVCNARWFRTSLVIKVFGNEDKNEKCHNENHNLVQLEAPSIKSFSIYLCPPSF